jgi:hypothetical protein
MPAWAMRLDGCDENRDMPGNGLGLVGAGVVVHVGDVRVHLRSPMVFHTCSCHPRPARTCRHCTRPGIVPSGGCERTAGSQRRTDTGRRPAGNRFRRLDTLHRTWDPPDHHTDAEVVRTNRSEQCPAVVGKPRSRHPQRILRRRRRVARTVAEVAEHTDKLRRNRSGKFQRLRCLRCSLRHRPFGCTVVAAAVCTCRCSAAKSADTYPSRYPLRTRRRTEPAHRTVTAVAAGTCKWGPVCSGRPGKSRSLRVQHNRRHTWPAGRTAALQAARSGSCHRAGYGNPHQPGSRRRTPRPHRTRSSAVRDTGNQSIPEAARNDLSPPA